MKHILKFILVLSLGVTPVQAAVSKAEVINVSGKASVVEKAGQPARLLKKGDFVPVGAKIYTDVDSMVALKLLPGSHVMLEEQGAFMLDKVAGTKMSEDEYIRQDIELTLTRGSLITDFAPADGNSSLVVKTGEGIFSTKSSTAQIILSTLEVNVLSGMAEVAIPSQKALVSVSGNQSLVMTTDSANVSSVSINFLTSNRIAKIARTMGDGMGKSVAALLGPPVGAPATAAPIVVQEQANAPIPSFVVIGGSSGNVRSPNNVSPIASPSTP